MAPHARRWDSIIPRIVATILIVISGVGLLAAINLLDGSLTWDVKGRVLRRFELGLLAGAFGVAGLLAATAAAGVWNGRRWGRVLAVGLWVLVGLSGLTTDRSVAGPGEPLSTYLVDMMLLPVAVTVLLLWLPRPSRRFFSDHRGRHTV